MKTIHTLYLFIIISKVEIIKGQNTCLTNNECRWCEYCLSESMEKEYRRCFKPFESLDQACNTKSLCDNYECKNQGQCVETRFYSKPSCNCTADFYGTHCQYRVPQGMQHKYATGVAAVVSVNQDNTVDQRFFEVMVYASASNYGEDLAFLATTPIGFIGWFDIHPSSACSETIYPYRLCEQSGCSGITLGGLQPSCGRVYRKKITFPFILTQNENTLAYLSAIVGYTTTINVKAFNKGIEVYDEDFPVVVNYNDFGIETKYVPIVSFLKCPDQFEARTLLYKQSVVEIEGVVTRDLFENTRGETKVVWSIYEVIGLGSGRKYASQFPLKYQVEQKRFFFSFSPSALNLDFGIYMIAASVTNVMANVYGINYATCYLEVTRLPLIARISGGSERIISSDSMLQISGSKSYDPNEGNQHLSFSWTFSPELVDYILKPVAEQVIPNSALRPGTTYVITLKVEAPNMVPGFAKQTVLVSKKHENDYSISILCQMNCLDLVRYFDPLILEVISNETVTNDDTFIWTYTVENGTATSTDNIRDPAYPSNILCIEANVLEEGKTYTFMVESKIRHTKAKLTIQVLKKIEKGKCNVFPNSGRVGETLFRVVCSGFLGMSSLIYEFFDTFPQEIEDSLSGRLLDVNTVGIVEDVWLTRGTVHIVVYDIYGGMVIVETQETISLEPALNPEIELNKAFQTTDKLMSTGQLIFGVGTAIPDLLDSKPDKDKIRNFTVAIGLVCSKSATKLKRCLSLIENTVNSLKKHNFKFDQILTIMFIETIYKLTILFDNLVGSRKTIPHITHHAMTVVTTSFLTALEVIINNRDIITIPDTYDEESPFDFNEELKYTFYVEQIFKRISKAIIYRQGKGYKTLTIGTESGFTNISSKSDDPKNIMINEELMLYEEISIVNTKLKYNPFLVEKLQTSTSLMGFSIFGRTLNRYKLKPITLLREPIDIILEDVDVKSGKFSMSVKQLDPKLPLEELEKQVQVIRVDVAPRSKIFIKIHLHNSESEVRVYANRDIRPDYEILRAEQYSTKITSSNPDFEVPYTTEDIDSFVYIGILAGFDVPIGQSVNFEVEIHYNLCLNWFGHKWITSFCKVGPQTSRTAIHCSCNHLSFFGAIFAVPPNEMNPFIDIPLLMQATDNMFIVAFVLVFLLLFSLIILWASWKDRKDKARKDVIFLEDNFPLDEYCYLVAVYTGWRWFSGTDANVGLRIMGSLGNSRAHILKSKYRATLQSGSDDWFLIRCLTHLGTIHQIHVWHDNAGFFPEWFCEKIFVYDLHERVAYTFYIEGWIGLGVDDFPEAVVVAATKSQINNVKRLFFENLFYSMRQTHGITNILAHHPLSNITRLDKVMTLLTFLLMKMLLTIAFFKYAYINVEVDDPAYSFGTRDVIVAFQVLITSSIIILAITIAFHKGYNVSTSSDIVPKVYARKENEDGQKHLYPNDSEIIIMPDQEAKEKAELNIYQIIVHMLRKNFKPLPLLPITLSRRTAVRPKQRKWYITAWASVILICVISPILIIIYGIKFGQQKSKKWASCFLCAAAQHFLIIAPLKYAVLAVILSTNFERWVQMPKYNVDAKQLLEARTPEVAENYLLLLERRKDPMYKPIRVELCKHLRTRAIRRKRLYDIFDLFITILYIVFVCLACSQYWIEERLRAVDHVQKTVFKGIVPKEGHLVFSDKVLTSFVGEALVKAIYSERWYNKKPISSPNLRYEWMKYWVSDCTTKLIGPPILRQIRLSRGTCSINKMFKDQHMKCIPLWSKSVENKDDYVMGWQTAGWKDTSGPYTPWKYLEPRLSTYPGIRGGTGVSYPGGGYVAELSTDQHKTLITLLDLLQGNWVDPYSRMVFVAFSLYNVNLNMFYQVILGAEHLPYTVRAISQEFTSVKIRLETIWSISYVLYCAITLFFISRAVAAMNKYGFKQYIHQAKNIYELMIISLGVSSIAFFIVHIFVSSAYIESFHRQGFDVFFDYASISRYFSIAFSLLAILFCFLVCLAISIVPFGNKKLSVYYMTFFYGLPTLIVFLTVLIIFVYVSVKLIGSILNLFMAESGIVFWRWANTLGLKLGVLPAFSLVFISICIKLFEKTTFVLFSTESKRARLLVEKRLHET